MTDTNTNDSPFLQLLRRLAVCSTDGNPETDDHKRWTEILKAMYRQQSPLALAFLASINISGTPNESPQSLLLRAHQKAKALLPDLEVKQRMEYRGASQSNREKFLKQKAEFDPFLDDSVNLTRDAYSGQSEVEPESPTFVDARGNVCQ